jgi:hypothetical protein
MSAKTKTRPRFDRPAADRDPLDDKLSQIVERSLERVERRAQEIVERRKRKLEQEPVKRGPYKKRIAAT